MSTADSFVHLHVASGFSMRHGTSSPKALAERAAELGMDALALTDRDGLYGAIRFARACLDAGIAPILGADLAVRPDSAAPAEPVPEIGTGSPATAAPAGSVPKNGTGSRPDRAARAALRPPRVTVLAAGGGRGGGWAALCRTVTAAHGTDPALRGDPAVSPELIARQIAAAHAPDGALLVLLGPDSEVGRAVVAGRPDLAAAELRRWRERAAGAQIAVELVHHLAPPGHPCALHTAARMYRLAREAGVPAVLTNAVRYALPEEAPVADVLDAARRLVPLDLRHRDRVNAEAYLKPGAEMAVLAEEVVRAAGGDASDARRLLHTTRSLAAALALDPHADLGFGSVRMPEAGLLLDGGPGPGSGPGPGPGASPSPAAAAAAAAPAELRARCEAGIGRRYPGASADALREVHRRLDEELGLIGALGYEAYFLTVAEVADLTRGLGIRCAARGSGAGSLVNHLLGISGVDPMRHGLLMERFLSDRRTALPDIDLDVESARRTEVYDALLGRFGADRTLCVSMMETYRARHAVRDVGAALGLPQEEIDALAKAFPHIRARDVRSALRDLPELRSSRLDEGLHRVLFDLVERLDGLPRQIALHPSGILLSDLRLRDRTPAEFCAQGYPMSQFDKDDVEEIGLLKLDVLGVRMQSAMAHAVRELARVDGEQAAPDLDAVPLDDPETFELIRSTRTLGCFQIESPGQRELLGKFGPKDFDDIVIDISLFRPGPVKSDMVTPFLNARQGWKPATYPHPKLRPVLAETEGVVVFHEQVIRTIAVFTGCTHARADQARRALGSKDGQLAVRDWFTTAADRQGFDRAAIERVWEILAAFASFGFCKAHAAAFALPTYQSAWLKTHHPAAFYAGVLTHDPGMYPKRLILDDARHFGVPVLPPDVNASGAQYTVEPAADGTPGVRIALADVKGITEAEISRIVTERRGGETPYTSLDDFRARARPSRPVLENLIQAGALDPLAAGATRRDLLFLAAQEPPTATRGSAPAPGQLALPAEPAPPPRLPAPTTRELVRGELEVLGLDHSAHVLQPYEELFADLGVTRARDLLQVRNRTEILVAGVKVATQTPPVRTGTRVVFATLDDATGPIDLALFEDAQEHYAATVFGSWLLLVRGTVRRTGPRGVSLTATGAWDLDRLAALPTDEARALTAERLTPDADAATRPRRVLVHPSGYRVSPYADLATPGTPAKQAPRRLWHTSPGSPG